MPSRLTRQCVGIGLSRLRQPVVRIGLDVCSLTSSGILIACHQVLAASTSAISDAAMIEEVALAVLLEDGAEDPAVAVEVGELRVLQVRVEIR